MCGTAVFENEHLLREMCFVMRHRGLDGGSMFKNVNFNLWHQLLSIICLEGEHLTVNSEWRNVP